MHRLDDEDPIDTLGKFILMGVATLALVISIVIGLWAWWLA